MSGGHQLHGGYDNSTAVPPPSTTGRLGHSRRRLDVPEQARFGALESAMLRLILLLLR